MSEHVFGDMSEEFEFDEEEMDYVDGPFSGWLRRKRDSAWFVYECQCIINKKLWHWSLFPVAEKEPDVSRVLERAAKGGSAWISITEDRRSGGASVCRLVKLER